MFLLGFNNYFDIYEDENGLELKNIDEMASVDEPQIWNVPTVVLSSINVNTIKILNSIFYTVYGKFFEEDGVHTISPEEEFDENTIIKALFYGNLSAGSFNFNSGEILGINVKRRYQDEYQLIYTYKTLYDEDGNDIYAFSFEDNTVRLGESYSYAMFPIFVDSDGQPYEQDYIPDGGESQSFSVDYLGAIISDGTQSYSSYMNIEVKRNKNKPVSVYTAQGKKYPYIISNGNINYSSGTLSGVFVLSENCEPDFENARTYREDFYSFLYNGSPKLLRFYDGSMWLIQISSETITEDNSEHPNLVSVSFEWTEIDDCDNLQILSDYGIVNSSYFIDLSEQLEDGVSYVW